MTAMDEAEQDNTRHTSLLLVARLGNQDNRDQLMSSMVLEDRVLERPITARLKVSIPEVVLHDANLGPCRYGDILAHSNCCE